VKVPADGLDAALAAFRSFGRVQNESQGSEDVTQQSIDLDARLANARHTEQRLAAVLEHRTGSVADVLTVEQEIARVRGTIEQMDAERKRLTTRVAFATLELRLDEERRAELGAPAQSIRGDLRNAAVDGLRAGAESALAALMFALRVGPTAGLWLLILAWPARRTFARLRSLSTQRPA
jgi:hypothetical protein